MTESVMNTLTREEILRVANSALRDIQLAPNLEVVYAIAVQAMNVMADSIPDDPREVIHTVGIGYCDNCNCEHCSEIRNPENRGESR